jgi:hypothetical protein
MLRAAHITAVVVLTLSCLVWGPAAGADATEAERIERRIELRRQIEAERERSRAEGGQGRSGIRVREGRLEPRPGGPPALPGHGPMSPVHGGHYGPRHADGDGLSPWERHRLSPEERRALRHELRQQRP